MLDLLSESHEVVHIAGARHAAVLISADDWQSIQETLFLASVPGMRASLVEGLHTPLR